MSSTAPRTAREAKQRARELNQVARERKAGQEREWRELDAQIAEITRQAKRHGRSTQARVNTIDVAAIYRERNRPPTEAAPSSSSPATPPTLAELAARAYGPRSARPGDLIGTSPRGGAR